jgi:hypothetical protein
MRTLHPTIDCIAYIWRPGGGIESASYEYTDTDSEAFWRCPFYHLLHLDELALHFSLEGENELDFPILEDFRKRGATDYYLRRIEFFSRELAKRNRCLGFLDFRP